jgi:hypothetical protein
MENLDFLTNTYNIGGAVGLLMALALVDLCLKGWGMWRAARMEKKYWFIALLIVNSVGILPIVFLLMTKQQYAGLTKAHQNVPSTT